MRACLAEDPMFRLVIRLSLALCAGLVVYGAHAAPAPQPVPRNGSCPSGYYSSGDYCVPGSGARFALSRNGSCPSGYYSSGNYCVASSDDSKLAIPRSSSCPSGYYSSGNYCVASQ